MSNCLKPITISLFFSIIVQDGSIQSVESVSVIYFNKVRTVFFFFFTSRLYLFGDICDKMIKASNGLLNIFQATGYNCQEERDWDRNESFLEFQR